MQTLPKSVYFHRGHRWAEEEEEEEEVEVEEEEEVSESS